MRQSQKIPEESQEPITQVEAEESFNSLMVNIGVERYQSEEEIDEIAFNCKYSNEPTQEKDIQDNAVRKTLPMEKGVKDSKTSKKTGEKLSQNSMVEPPQQKNIITPIKPPENIPSVENIKSNEKNDKGVLENTPNQKEKCRVTFTDLGRVINEPQEAQSASPIMTEKFQMKIIEIKEKVPAKRIKKPKPLKITAKKLSKFFGKKLEKPNDLSKSDIPLSEKNSLPFLDYNKGSMDQNKISVEQFDQMEENISDKIRNRSTNKENPLQKKNPLPYNGSSGSEEDIGTIKFHVQQAEVHFNSSKVSGYFEKRTREKFHSIRKPEQFDRIEDNFENILLKPTAPSQDMNSLFDKLRKEYLVDLRAEKTVTSTTKQNTRRSYNPTRYSIIEQAIDYEKGIQIENDKVDQSASLKPIQRRRKLDTFARTAAKKAPPKRLKKKKLEFDMNKTCIEIEQNQTDLIPVRSAKKLTQRSYSEMKSADVDLSIPDPDKSNKIDDPIIIDNDIRSANEKSVEAVEDDLDFNAISSATNNDIELLNDPDIAISSATNKKVGFRDVGKAIHEFSDGINALRNVLLSCEKRDLQDQFVGQIDVVEKSSFEIQIDQETFSSALYLICKGINMVSSGVALLAPNMEISKQH